MRATFPGLCLALVFVLVVVAEPNDPTKSPPMVLKCCRYGEELRHTDGSDGDGLPRCVPTSNEWKPLVYSPTQQTFSSQPPVHWRILDGSRPKCGNRSEVILVPYRKANPFILLDNGKAILETGSSDSIANSHYCADSNALLVCVPKKSAGNHAAATMRPRVRRCCGENATFHEHG